MLESLDQSNIKRMSLESPEAGREVFDLDQEFTVNDWHDMAVRMPGVSTQDAPMSAAMTANVKALRPDSNLRPYFTNADLKRWEMRFGLENRLPQVSEAQRIAVFMSANAHVAFGNSEFCQLKPEHWQAVHKAIEAYRANKEWYQFIQMAHSAIQLGGQILFSETEKAEIKKYFYTELNEKRVNVTTLTRIGELFPEMNLEIPPEKYQMIWDEMREQKKQRSWIDISARARFLNLFKSSSIPKLDKGPGLIPEQRNF